MLIYLKAKIQEKNIKFKTKKKQNKKQNKLK